MLAAIFEDKAAPGDQISDCRGRKDLARSRQGGHPRADMNCDSTDVLARMLDLSDMDARADLDP